MWKSVTNRKHKIPNVSLVTVSVSGLNRPTKR